MTKPKRTFQIGDRVRFWLDDKATKYTGVVRAVLPYGLLRLASDDTCRVLYPVVHPKQCRLRRFKQKAEPKKAREYTVLLNPDGSVRETLRNHHEAEAGYEARVVKVREVLPGEKSYRDGLVAALDVLVDQEDV